MTSRAWAIFASDKIVFWTVRASREEALDAFYQDRMKGNDLPAAPFEWWKKTSLERDLSVRQVTITIDEAPNA